MHNTPGAEALAFQTEWFGIRLPQYIVDGGILSWMLGSEKNSSMLLPPELLKILHKC